MAIYLRGIVLLYVLGLLTALCFFWGDILTTYAVLGLFLPVAAILILPPVGYALLGEVPHDRTLSARVFRRSP